MHVQKRLDLGCNPDYVTFMVVGLRLSIAGYDSVRFTWSLCNSKNFAGSAALAEVCALLSAVLVCNLTTLPDVICNV